LSFTSHNCVEGRAATRAGSSIRNQAFFYHKFHTSLSVCESDERYWGKTKTKKDYPGVCAMKRFERHFFFFKSGSVQRSCFEKSVPFKYIIRFHRRPSAFASVQCVQSPGNPCLQRGIDGKKNGKQLRLVTLSHPEVSRLISFTHHNHSRRRSWLGKTGAKSSSQTH
jgi:hypothetical protein